MDTGAGGGGLFTISRPPQKVPKIFCKNPHLVIYYRQAVTAAQIFMEKGRI
jgi:hypothetical protein